jgi:hypothetical protein
LRLTHRWNQMKVTERIKAVCSCFCKRASCKFVICRASTYLQEIYQSSNQEMFAISLSSCSRYNANSKLDQSVSAIHDSPPYFWDQWGSPPTPTSLVTHARDNWWTIDFANAFVSPGVNSRGELVPSPSARGLYNYYTSGRFLTLKFRFQLKFSDRTPPMSDALLRPWRPVQSPYNTNPCSCDGIWKSKHTAIVLRSRGVGTHSRLGGGEFLEATPWLAPSGTFFEN